MKKKHSAGERHWIVRPVYLEIRQKRNRTKVLIERTCSLKHFFSVVPTLKKDSLYQLQRGFEDVETCHKKNWIKPLPNNRIIII